MAFLEHLPHANRFLKFYLILSHLILIITLSDYQNNPHYECGNWHLNAYLLHVTGLVRSTARVWIQACLTSEHYLLADYVSRLPFRCEGTVASCKVQGSVESSTDDHPWQPLSCLSCSCVPWISLMISNAKRLGTSFGNSAVTLTTNKTEQSMVDSFYY